MNDQIILLSLPNMGTDWLASALVTHNPALRYYREFFNPITNWKYADILATAWGCEIPSTVGNIASPSVPLEAVYRQTWLNESFNFTKENFSPFRLPFFASRFQVFVLLRTPELVFPPGRPSVYAWYDALYEGMLADDDVRGLLRVAAPETLNQRCVAACEILSQKLRADAARFGVRVLDYDLLMKLPADDLARYVANVPGVLGDGSGLADVMVKTRKEKVSAFEQMGADDVLGRLRAV